MKRLLLFIFILALLFANTCTFAQSADAEGEGNLIRNGDFSDFYAEKPAEWSMDSFSADDTPVFEIAQNESDNSPCLYMSSVSDNDLKAVQTLTVEKNTYLKLSCIAKCENLSGSGAFISVIDNFNAHSEAVTSDDWTYTELFVCTGDLTRITIALRIGYYGDLCTGEAWFDDVKAETVDSSSADFVVLKEFVPENNAADTMKATPDDSMPYLAQMIIAIVLTAAVGIVIYIFMLIRKSEKSLSGKAKPWVYLLLMLFFALVIRIICNFVFRALNGAYGHSTDISCFFAWGYRMADVGPSEFYAPGYFADYPPGYMWILGAMDVLRRIFGIPHSTPAHALIMKLPSIACDLVSVYLIYKVAIRCGRKPRTALLYAACLAFNPLVIFISSVWGQIDIMLSLFSALAFLFFIKACDTKKLTDYIWSGIMYGIAVALKPQALMIGPMYALVFIMRGIREIKEQHTVKNTLIGAVSAAACAVAMIILPALPFTGNQEGLWLIDKYAGTASSYNYASVEAYNFFALVNANWVWADNEFMLGLTYKQFGTICMGVSIAVSIVLYVICFKKKKKAAFAITAFMLAGIFTFGHYMHERYLFPAVIFVLFAFVFLNDRRLFISYIAFTCTMLYNAMGAFLIVDCKQIDTYTNAVYTSYPAFVRAGSVMTILAFMFFAYTVIAITFEKDARRHSAYNIALDKNGNKTVVID